MAWTNGRHMAASHVRSMKYSHIFVWCSHFCHFYRSGEVRGYSGLWRCLYCAPHTGRNDHIQFNCFSNSWIDLKTQACLITRGNKIKIEIHIIVSLRNTMHHNMFILIILISRPSKNLVRLMKTICFLYISDCCRQPITKKGFTVLNVQLENFTSVFNHLKVISVIVSNPAAEVVSCLHPCRFLHFRIWSLQRLLNLVLSSYQIHQSFMCWKVFHPFVLPDTPELYVLKGISSCRPTRNTRALCAERYFILSSYLIH